MKKLIVTCAGALSVLLLTVSVASASKSADLPLHGKSTPAKACAAEKKADRAAFYATYGKHAMRDCIKAETVPAADQPVAKNAAKACKAERAADPAGFQLKYGSNANGRNAFGKCVSAKVKKMTEDDAAPLDPGEDESQELPAAA